MSDNLSFLENSRPHDAISIIPIPLNIGSDNHDMAAGPTYLLKLGLENALKTSGFTPRVLPEIPTVTKDNNFSSIVDVVTRAKKVVEAEISSGNKVVALGGDHAISIGTIAGASKAFEGDLGVIWIDAHGDMNTTETSLSGNIHGMASATILGLGDKTLTDLVDTKIKKENILYIGLKDLDQAEIDLMRNNKLDTVTIMDILIHGFPLIIEKIKTLNKKVSHIWVSLDIDSVDEECAPASAMATSGSLTFREITNLCTHIGKVSNVIGMDIVELTPNKDEDEKTGRLCIELIASTFGGKHSWYSAYMSSYKKD